MREYEEIEKLHAKDNARKFYVDLQELSGLAQTLVAYWMRITVQHQDMAIMIPLAMTMEQMFICYEGVWIVTKSQQNHCLKWNPQP